MRLEESLKKTAHCTTRLMKARDKALGPMGIAHAADMLDFLPEELGSNLLLPGRED